MVKVDWRKRMVTTLAVPLTALSVLATVTAYAGGGTARPPAGAIAPFVTATLPDPVTSVIPALIHGFDDTGFIQGATLDTTNVNCPNRTRSTRTASVAPSR